MLTKLSLGAELDIVSGKEMESGLNEVLDEMRGKQDPKPQYFSRPGSVTRTGTFVLEIGKPPIGRIWNVLGLTVCGQTDATVPTTGSIALYFGDSANPMLSQLKYPKITVPSLTTFSGRGLWCTSAESIFLSATNTDLTQLTGIAHIAEWRECDVVQSSGR